MTNERAEFYLDKFQVLVSKLMDDDKLTDLEKYAVLEIASEEMCDNLPSES